MTSDPFMEIADDLDANPWLSPTRNTAAERAFSRV